MQSGYICVAGVDMKTMVHVRPVQRSGRLPVALAGSAGGPFAIAAFVDLGVTQSASSPPETEDLIFNPAQIRLLRTLGPTDFWNLLKTISKNRLQDIFGPALHPQSNGAAVDESQGTTSLGCLRPAAPPRLFINPWGKLRANITEGSYVVELSVTDLRMYEPDQKTPRSNVMTALQKRIDAGTGVLLSVGLARAYQASNDTERRHWLQINNLHLEDDPTWQG
jgi:hypothetical protein